jgi:uncharacterized membrane protein SpoIIM required for sporulation
MDFRRFVDTHRALWKRLEVLLDRVDRAGLARLPSAEVRELARLYRKTSADLLLARDVAGGADVVDYLEAIVGRAYAVIHQPRRFKMEAITTFLKTGFPILFRQESRYVATAGAVLALGFVVAFVLTLVRPEAFDFIVPAEIAAFYGDEPGQDHRGDRFGEMDDSQAAEFSSTILVNNVRVTIKAFGFGLTAGVGTIAVLFQNGALLGAIAANFVRWERSLDLWALILPHGVVEFFAILLGAAGGLILADALLRPGRRRRTEAIRARGRVALALALPAAPLLLIAAIIEGYITPMAAIPPGAKLLFAAATGVALVLYLRAPRVRGPRAA